ncbi:hypothetical protein [Corallococcus sp. 4LFB]|uniref:hypothetical protein n=1 Tax=Corallococcus sp. 4LFB TaxID=3383249 RepID=UPI003975D95E
MASERERLQSDLTVARAARVRLEGRTNSLETAAADAVRILDAERAERDQLAARIREQQARLEALETERETLVQALEEAKTSAAPPPEDVLEMAAEMEVLQAHVEKMQDQLAAREAELAELRRAMPALDVPSAPRKVGERE